MAARLKYLGGKAVHQGVNQKWGRLLNTGHPGFLDEVLSRIRDSECEYTGTEGDSFLVDHTVQVCALVYRLCRLQQVDAEIPVLVGLFHDAGKFHHGNYHKTDVPEEEHSALFARELLNNYGFDTHVIDSVSAAIRALYVESATRTVSSDLVHDADFLVKSGCTGVAQFFIKATLRQNALLSTVGRSLSKELTYALALVSNMRTPAGRQLARTKQIRVQNFFRALIDELREDEILDLRMDIFDAEIEPGTDPPIPIVIVRETACSKCGSDTDVRFRQEQGLKCMKLIAEIVCGDCFEQNTISFCLPEIVGTAPIVGNLLQQES